MLDDDDIKFMEKVIEVCREGKRNTELPFTCPICGGHASAFISSYNGHKHAKCFKCGIDISE